jgi:two-component system CheB/CheR fusion protein
VEPSEEYWYLVLFQETASLNAEAGAKGKGRPPEKELTRVRAELDSTRESLQAIIEEREATNEKLKGANEEIQSANEELQSTNEELETAKEELQSANEELTTVNEELGTRNSELAQLNNDLNNLLGSINIPIIIVDNSLVVRRVTPLARNLFNLLPSDVGRQIGDIKPKLDIPDLEQMLRGVIDSLNNEEREVTDRKGHTFSLRVRPYRTTDNKIDGAVITLVDIEEIKRLAGIQIEKAARSGRANRNSSESSR